MNIAIDISRLQSGHAHRGSGTYVRELIAALQEYGKNHTYTVVTAGQSIPADADIIHYPYFDPFLLTLPVIKEKPIVVTVHDLIPLVFPDKFPKGLRGSIVWQIQKYSLRGARRIITDSEVSKEDICRITGFTLQNIDVVPLAQSAIFKESKVPSMDSLQKKYHIPLKYLLYVGDVNWNKNIKALLEAYALLIHKNPKLHPALVLVGGVFHNTGIAEVQEINSLIHTLNIQASVIKTGFVPDEDLAGMYTHAVCTVQPSRYEGFGFPVLEAMACGSPVISSNASSLAEILGPALAVSPDDVEGMASRMIDIALMPVAKRATLIKEGKAWASKFTWKKVAEETIEVYERIRV